MNLEQAEWLEADGLGGFASGTASGIRTRRYHALLLAAARPPTERFVLVNGLDAAVEWDGAWIAISTQNYRGGVRHPDGVARLESFERRPWPVWRWRLADGVALEQELFVPRGSPETMIRFRLLAEAKKAKALAKDAKLAVRLLLSGRDDHALHAQNPHFRFEGSVRPGRVTWQPYDGVPGIELQHDGEYRAMPLWYRRFSYAEEIARGLDDGEDLACPGEIVCPLAGGEAVLRLRAVVAGQPEPERDEASTLAERFRKAATRERRRRAQLGAALHLAADSYIVSRGSGRTVLAGYPWFTDWGRDTFVAMRGLCLATGRLADAQAILSEWAGAVSEGMVPNRFPDRGEAPEYDSVDASLWYVVVVGEFLDAMAKARKKVAPAVLSQLTKAVHDILSRHAEGTRFGIRADSDGLLASGVPGRPLTWMDARSAGREITPRIGKAVEVQALWIHALRVGARLGDSGWDTVAKSARASFEQRFWNPETGGLFDVVDVDHVPGRVDATLRPNQILAVGGLAECLLGAKRAASVVDLVEDQLLTPLGLRTLSPDDPMYRGRYEGSPARRDAAYHQGTAWPWLLGAFVEAWLRVRGGTRDAVAEARSRFLPPLEQHLSEAGLSHVSEIADGDAPHAPRGCPFQAWSVGETLRLTERILAPPAAAAPAGTKAAKKRAARRS